MSRKKLSIYVDGAARGNPGPAAIGVVVCSEDGSTIGNVSEYIGDATNNVAEYKALIYGLKKAREMEADEVSVNTDSELLASQMTGRFKVKNEALKGLFAESMNLVRGFKNVEITQIPRSANHGADKLANKALDEINAKANKGPIKNIRINTDLL